MNSRPGLLQIGQPADLAGFAFRKPTFSLTDSTLQLRFSDNVQIGGTLARAD